MGNVFTKKLTSRQKICKILYILPNWFFEPTSRIIINPAVLKIPEELENYYKQQEWDSVLDYSIDSLDTEFEEKCKRKRRHTISCYKDHVNAEEDDYDDFDSNEFSFSDQRKTCSECSCGGQLIQTTEVEELKNEIRLLREQIINLQRNFENEKIATCTTSTPQKFNANVFIPPPPPISPSFNLDAAPTVANRNENTLLNEITNVKLKPAKIINQKSNDFNNYLFNNNLHEILKKRYAAMHSPCTSFYDNGSVDVENNRNPFNDFQQTQESVSIYIN